MHNEIFLLLLLFFSSLHKAGEHPQPPYPIPSPQDNGSPSSAPRAHPQPGSHLFCGAHFGDVPSPIKSPRSLSDPPGTHPLQHPEEGQRLLHHAESPRGGELRGREKRSERSDRQRATPRARPAELRFLPGPPPPWRRSPAEPSGAEPPASRQPGMRAAAPAHAGRSSRAGPRAPRTAPRSRPAPWERSESTAAHLGWGWLFEIYFY